MKRQLPPDPEQKNDQRAAWAGCAIAAFMEATGTDAGDALPDLLADVMHWCDRQDCDFDVALERGRDHYEAETAGDPAVLPATPIVIEVRGGVVQHVANLPPGCGYEVKDYDDLAATLDAATGLHPSDEPGGSKKYRVQVIVKTLETYEVEAADEDEAEDTYGLGKLVDTDDNLGNDIVSIEAV